MKALLLKQYMQMEYTDVPEPEIRPDEVLVRVKACGICGSDVHGFDGSSGRRLPPLIMGHEAAGEIAAVGAEVKGFAEGDRVTMDSTVFCGTCHFCRRGEINLCDNRQVLGVSIPEYRRHGAFAEYVAVPQQILYRLPNALSFEKAAMCEAVGVAVHAVNLTPVTLGDTAVVVGSGMVGQLVIQALHLAGCARVIAVDVDDAKLVAAKKLGADDCLNSKTADVAAFAREVTCGRGADIAVEVFGATEPIRTALTSVRKGGAVTLVGNITPKVELLLQSVVTRQVKLIGTCNSAGEYPACLDLLVRDAIRVDPMISAVAPLSEGVSWFHRLYNKEPNLMKVILRP